MEQRQALLKAAAAVYRFLPDLPEELHEAAHALAQNILSAAGVDGNTLPDTCAARSEALEALDD